MENMSQGKMVPLLDKDETSENYWFFIAEN